MFKYSTEVLFCLYLIISLLRVSIIVIYKDKIKNFTLKLKIITFILGFLFDQFLNFILYYIIVLKIGLDINLFLFAFIIIQLVATKKRIDRIKK